MLLPILQLLLLLVSSFVALTIVIIVKKQFGIPLLAILTLIFTLLGIILALFTLELQIKGVLRIFLIVTGISPVAMLVSVVLHNAISTLGKKFTGKEFEEPVFLLIGIFVCPAIFAIGDLGSIIMVSRIVFS